jgi:hypothetical protein
VSLYPKDAPAGVTLLATQLAKKFPSWSRAFVLVDPTTKLLHTKPHSALEIGRLADDRPDLVLGLALGHISRTTVVDLDKHVELNFKRFPRTVTATTPRPGKHLFYGPDEYGQLPKTRWLREAVPAGRDGFRRVIREKSYEVLSDGCYVPLPPARGCQWVVGGVLSPWPGEFDFATWSSRVPLNLPTHRRQQPVLSDKSHELRPHVTR